MTGYTVHTGSTEKFASGWDEIFKTKKAKDKKSARKTSVAKNKSAKQSKKKSGK
jgi:hypothetical protein